MNVMYLCRKSSGFSRGASIYRGVTRLQSLYIIFLIVEKYQNVTSCFDFNRHHQHGRWQARIGRVAGNKDLYLGTFSKFKLFLKYVCFDSEFRSMLVQSE